MPEWLEYGVTIFVGAVAVTRLVKYRNHGILKHIGESKVRFRHRLASWRTHG